MGIREKNKKGGNNMSLNRVVLVGRLTRDPELNYTGNGIAVANFNIACNRPFKNQQGEQEADFINCVIWRKAAESLANYQRKGNLIGVDGRVQTRSYEGQDGKMVYVTEIVAESVQFLESKGSQQSQASQQAPQQNNNQVAQQPNLQNQGQQIDIQDDDLPF